MADLYTISRSSSPRTTQTPWKIQPVIFTRNKKLEYFLIWKAFLHSIAYYGDWKLKFEYFSHFLIKYSIFWPFLSSKCVNNIVKRGFLIHFFNSVCAQLNYLKNSVLLVYIAFIVFCNRARNFKNHGFHKMGFKVFRRKKIKLKETVTHKLLWVGLWNFARIFSDNNSNDWSNRKKSIFWSWLMRRPP